MTRAEWGPNPGNESPEGRGVVNAKRRPDKAETGRGVTVGLSKKCVATGVLLNLLSLLLLVYDVAVGCEKDKREVEGMVNNCTKSKDERICNAGADVLYERG